jgi:hypothetical protein
MPIWRLPPRNLDDDEWEASLYTGEVFIRAEDARDARRMATARFMRAVTGKTAGKPRWNPWEQARLVRCLREEYSGYTTEGPAGILWPQQHE